MPGPLRTYDRIIKLWIADDMLEQLDQLRGNRSRSQAIRDLIKVAAWLEKNRIDYAECHAEVLRTAVLQQQE